MEFVPSKLITPSGEQAITLRSQRSVAHLKRSASGREIKHASHGMGATVQVAELTAQQQHAAAFGVERPALGKTA